MTDQEIINKMERLGGSFVQALAKAARAADPDNLQRIKNTWPEYWQRYSSNQIVLATREKHPDSEFTDL